jgi:hypothetical protein
MEIKRFTQFLKESTENNENAPDPSKLSVIKDDGKEAMLLRDSSTNKIWFFFYESIDKKDLAEFGGDPDYDDADYEPTELDKLKYVKANIKNFTIGKGVNSHSNGDDLVEVDQMLAHVLLDIFRNFTYKDLGLS